jgi:predicted nuclease of predicted toxin-antitoxin system
VRILLDECVPRKLGGHLPGHAVTTVPKQKLGGSRDDRLLQAAAAGFDLIITVDRNLIFQQHVRTIPVAVIVLHATSNRLAALLPLVPELLSTINRIKSRQVLHVPQAATP